MHEMTWRDDGIVKDFNTFTPSQTPEPNINTSQNCRFFCKSGEQHVQQSIRLSKSNHEGRSKSYNL